MRLIDADALVKKWQDILDSRPEEKGTVAYQTFELFIEALKSEPTIDVEVVVRCKDCENASVYDNDVFCDVVNEYMGLDGYCVCGKRKE